MPRKKTTRSAETAGPGARAARTPWPLESPTPDCPSRRRRGAGSGVSRPGLRGQREHGDPVGPPVTGARRRRVAAGGGAAARAPEGRGGPAGRRGHAPAGASGGGGAADPGHPPALSCPGGVGAHGAADSAGGRPQCAARGAAREAPAGGAPIRARGAESALAVGSVRRSRTRHPPSCCVTNANTQWCCRGQASFSPA